MFEGKEKAWVWNRGGEKATRVSGLTEVWKERKGVAKKRIGMSAARKKWGRAGSALGYACANLHPHFLASKAPGTSRFGVVLGGHPFGHHPPSHCGPF